jgi:hypothetical protein
LIPGSIVEKYPSMVFVWASPRTYSPMLWLTDSWRSNLLTANAAFVDHDHSCPMKLDLKDWTESFRIDSRNMVRANAAATFYQRENGFLVDASGALVLAFAAVLVLLKVADKALVDFDRLAFVAENVGVSFAQ